MTRRSAPLLAAALLAGCGSKPPVVAAPPVAVEWRRLATEADRTRLRNWRVSWVDALTKVRARAGGPAALAGDPLLFDPDRALADAALPIGAYRCRTAKLAPRDLAMRPVQVGAWTACALTPGGGAPRFTTTGSQRASGSLFADTDARSIFLGTLALGDETRPMLYGRDARRDMAGVLERIGPRRWRLVLPYPRFESTLDVIEIVAAS